MYSNRLIEISKKDFKPQYVSESDQIHELLPNIFHMCVNYETLQNIDFIKIKFIQSGEKNGHV